MSLSRTEIAKLDATIAALRPTSLAKVSEALQSGRIHALVRRKLELPLRAALADRERTLRQTGNTPSWYDANHRWNHEPVWDAVRFDDVVRPHVAAAVKRRQVKQNHETENNKSRYIK